MEKFLKKTHNGYLSINSPDRVSFQNKVIWDHVCDSLNDKDDLNVILFKIDAISRYL